MTLSKTLLSVAKTLPAYIYDEASTGHFRNYLTGILRYKALNAVRRDHRYADAVGRSTEETVSESSDSSDADFCQALMESALGQLMAGDEVSARDKRVFEQVAIIGVAPAEVVGCMVEGNESTEFFGHQGGIGIASGSSAKIVNTAVRDNTGDQLGAFGTPYNRGTSAEVVNCEISDGSDPHGIEKFTVSPRTGTDPIGYRAPEY